MRTFEPHFTEMMGAYLGHTEPAPNWVRERNVRVEWIANFAIPFDRSRGYDPASGVFSDCSYWSIPTGLFTYAGRLWIV